MPSLRHDDSEWAQSSHRRPIVHQRGPTGGQAFSLCSSPPSVSSLLPSLPTPPRHHLSYRPTCLASPLLPYHYDTLTEWPRIGQVFRGREEVRRRGALRQAERRWQSLPLCFIFRVVKRVTIDLIICII